MIGYRSLLIVWLIGLAAILAAPGQALLPQRTLLPLDFLHEALLPWANEVRQPRFGSHYEIDAVQEYLPLYQLQADALGRAEFPAWNPFNRGGAAHLDNPVPVPFHPLKFLLAVLPAEQVFDLITVTHFLLAFVAMSLYLRFLGLAAPAVLFGAASWAFCGFFVLNYVHERVLGAYGLLPLNLMLLERLLSRPNPRQACQFGMVLGFSMLIADPTGILVYSLAFAARLAGRIRFERETTRWPRWLPLVAVVAFGIAAPTLLSTFEGLATNVRVFDYAEKHRLGGGIGPWVGGYLALAASAIHPYALGSRDGLDLLKLVGHTLTMTPFAGSYAVPLALLAIRPMRQDAQFRWLWLLVALALILLLPPIADRLATRNVILLSFVLALAGALGMHRWWTSPHPALAASSRRLASFALVAVLAFVAREAALAIHGEALAQLIRDSVESRLPGHLLERYAQWNSARVDRFLSLQRMVSPSNALFLLGLAALALAWRRYAASGAIAWKIAVPVIATLAPALFLLDQVNVVDLRRYPVPQTLPYLALPGADPGPPRIAIPREDPNDRLLMPALLPQLFGLGQVQGYGSVFPLGPAVLTRELTHGHPLYEVLGVNYYLTAKGSRQEVPAAFARLVHRGEVSIHARDTLASRFRLVNRLAVSADRVEASNRARADARPVAERDFHIGTIPDGYRPAPHADPGTVRVLRDEAELVELALEARTDALLVVGNTYFPGWSARVDGRDTAIHAVDGALQGTWIKAGERRVILQYSHWPSRTGFLIQLATLAACVLVLRRRR